MKKLVVRQLGEKGARKRKGRVQIREGPEESLKSFLLAMPNVGRDGDFRRGAQRRRKVAP